MIQLGANTVLFGGHDLRTALQHIAWAGYDAAEISALQGCGAFGDPLGEHLHLDRWRDEVDGIRALIEEFGLPLTAMEVGPLDEERVLEAFAAAEALGIGVINIGPSGKSDAPGDLEACIDRMAKLAEAGERHGVALCVKAHIGASMYNTETTLRVMDAIESPAFGIDMDPSHIHRGGEVPKDALEQVISRVKHVHIRDSGPGPAPGPAEEQACGRGEIDLMGYCRVLVEHGYDGPVNLEVIGASSYECSRSAIIAAESYGYLNACFKACGGRQEKMK
ncbi:MAG TPA: sugar phosphate isomerase/epimerase [Candidatus Hydrogenedentes bacterium]|nr:sugar phosphate isomerase/epimerase [Candidatus Hydrogenedentota bacterium]